MLNLQPAEAVTRDNHFTIAPGDPLPFGATIMPDGINFSVYSRHGTGCTLVLFRRGERLPFAEIPIPPEYRIGDVFPVKVTGLDPQTIEYGYRMDRPNNPAAGHRFDPTCILPDPPLLREMVDGPILGRTKLIAEPWDAIGLITDALILNPWDREIYRDGAFRFHPEYVEALAQQGVPPAPALLIPATPVGGLAKDTLRA